MTIPTHVPSSPRPPERTNRRRDLRLLPTPSCRRRPEGRAPPLFSPPPSVLFCGLDPHLHAALELGIVLDRDCFNTRGLGRGEEPGNEYIHSMKCAMNKYLHCRRRDFQSQQRWWRAVAGNLQPLESLRPGGCYGQVPLCVDDGVARNDMHRNSYSRLGLCQKKMTAATHHLLSTQGCSASCQRKKV